VLEQKFERTSIFQPGLLDRAVDGADKRTAERFAVWVGIPALNVVELANVMAETAARVPGIGATPYFSASEIGKVAKALEGTAAPPSPRL
jgi:hypothetical protein